MNLSEIQQGPARFAVYTIERTKLPDSFQISPEIRISAALNLDQYNHTFRRDLELISHYAELKAKREVEEKRKNNLVIETMVEKEIYVENIQVEPSVNDESKEQIISEMMVRTSQGKEVCQFYLESAGWNLEQAIEILNQYIA